MDRGNMAIISVNFQAKLSTFTFEKFKSKSGEQCGAT